jgi:hypothetical protein
MSDQTNISDDWIQSADLSIYEAAFWIKIGTDPRVHAYRAEIDDAYYDQYMQHPGGYEAVINKCEVIVSAIRAGLIKTTREVQGTDGSLNYQQTYISKADWLAWCDNNQLFDLIKRFGFIERIAPQLSKDQADTEALPSYLTTSEIVGCFMGYMGVDVRPQLTHLLG